MGLVSRAVLVRPSRPLARIRSSRVELHRRLLLRGGGSCPAVPAKDWKDRPGRLRGAYSAGIMPDIVWRGHPVHPLSVRVLVGGDGQAALPLQPGKRAVAGMPASQPSRPMIWAMVAPRCSISISLACLASSRCLARLFPRGRPGRLLTTAIDGRRHSAQTVVGVGSLRVRCSSACSQESAASKPASSCSSMG